MRRQPVARSFRRKPVQEARFVRTSKPKNLPPPVGGWNARDSLDGMAETDAVVLNNWFPQQSECTTRPGFAEHCDTGEAAAPKTLMTYGFAGAEKLLAAVNGKIINVTTATPSTLKSGMTGNDYVSDVLGGYLFMANGVDTMQVYDGSTVANATFTGLTLANIDFVKTYKSRVYVIEKNTQSMWYGGVGSVTGALTEFDFSTVVSVGGSLKLLAQLKGDGGDGGNDDVFLAIFEHGDVVAYTGSNPSDALNWSKLGQYKIGRPLSRFGIFAGDDDVYLITSRGYEKLGEIVKYGTSAPERLVMSNKIQKAVIDDINFLGVSDDWKLSLFPGAQMLIATVPRTGSARCYHVRNINTKAWCRFKDFNAYSWAMFGIRCYFGGDDGVIYKFGFEYTSDNGAAIVADGQPAWSNLGYSAYIKQVELVRVVLRAGSRPSTMVSLGSDFNDIGITPYESGEAGTFYYWDEAYWDEAYWFGQNSSYQQWFNRFANGHTIGMRLRVSSSQTSVRWNLTTYLFSLGGPL